ncbi:MAG: hypothetical protein MJ240_12895 [Kiritimatiellae bacterium]|nr:hypothetical protein [Kiritimatiellia bacterium]
MLDFAAILDKFEEALALESELGTRTVEIDRALLRGLPVAAQPVEPATPPPSAPTPAPAPAPAQPAPKPAPAPAQPAVTPPPPTANRPDFAFLLECEPTGPVAELLPKMSAAIGYGENGVKINDPTARVLIVLGGAALQKWLPGVKAIPGQWVKRGETPALVTASPTKTFRFFANDPAKILALKRRLWADLQAALAKLGKKPPARQK